MISSVRLLVPSALRSRRAARAASFAVIALLMMTAVLSAHAQSTDSSFSLLNGVQAKFQPLQYQWGAKVRVYAQRLFWALAAVDFGWTCITYIIDKNDIADMLGSLVRKMMTLSFFFALLKMADTWIPMIINSFTQIGQDAGGSGSSSTPDQIVSTGWSTALAMYEALNNKGLTDKIAMAIPVTALSILCFLAFLFVAVQLLVTLIETYIAIGAGIIMLGFGGSRWTTDMASKYMQYAVATGVKLMVIYLIVGAGQTLFDQSAMIDARQIIKSCMTAMGAGFVYAYLAFQVPAIASAMMSGSPSMTAGGMMGAAITAGAALAGAGAAAAGGGLAAAKGAGGAAAGATGLAKALSAGVNSGLDLGKSGTALASHALGEMGAHGLGMAKGAIGDAVGGARTGFAQSVDQSTGGKIASSIEATRGGSVAGVPAPQSSAAGASGAAQGSAGVGASQGTGGGATGAEAGQSEAQIATTAHAAESVASPVSAGSSSDGSQSAASASPSSASPASSGAVPAAGTSGAPASSSPASSSASPTAGVSSSPAPGSAGSTSAGSSGSAASSAAPSPGSSGASVPSSGGDVVSGSPSAATASPTTPTAGASGDASTASLSGNTQSANPSTPARNDPLHKRIQDLQAYVPQDSAHAASVNIDLKHSQD